VIWQGDIPSTGQPTLNGHMHGSHFLMWL